MTNKEFVRICKEIFPDCYIRREGGSINAYTSNHGEQIAQMSGKLCFAWRHAEVYCEKDEWTTTEFEERLKTVRDSFKL